MRRRFIVELSGETKTQPCSLGAALIKSEEEGATCMPARLHGGRVEERPLPTYRQQLALAMQESVQTSDVKACPCGLLCGTARDRCLVNPGVPSCNEKLGLQQITPTTQNQESATQLQPP